MELPLTSKLAARLIWLEEASSTNSQLIELSRSEQLPHFTVMATANQVSGRGRAGRVWQAPADTSLAISVLLNTQLPASESLASLGWLPLLSGLAMSQAVAALLPATAEGSASEGPGVKWPNDVLNDGLKLSGILSELVSVVGNQASVVVGAGINLSQTREQLPVETATSLSLAGAILPAGLPERFDLVLSAYLERLRFWYDRFTQNAMDADASGLRAAVSANCVSLGRQVRAILPGDTELVGTAVSIDAAGRIVLEVNGVAMPVAAGDIVHLRHN